MSKSIPEREVKNIFLVRESSQKVSNLLSNKLYKRPAFGLKVIACSGDCFHLTLLHFSLFPSAPSKPFGLLLCVSLCAASESNGNIFSSVISSDSPENVSFSSSYFKRTFDRGKHESFQLSLLAVPLSVCAINLKLSSKV